MTYGGVKTSSYMKNKMAKNDTAQFWGELTKMAKKAGKIESIDTRCGRAIEDPVGPATSINTTPTVIPASAVRGQGGIHKGMNGVSQRSPSGSHFHEHNREGRSMNAILRPDDIAHTRG